MPTITVYMSEENLQHVRKLRQAKISLSGTCREAIIAKSEALGKLTPFVVGDEVLLTMDGWYCDGMEGTIMGTLGTYLHVLLPDRTLGLFKANEMKHRERTIA